MTMEEDKVYVLKGGIQGQKYSLNALNYAWQLMDKIAKSINSTKQEVYMEMLSKVGEFIYTLALPENAPKSGEAYRLVIDRGETVMVNQKGKTFCFHTYQCYKCIHAYDSKEMAVFIDEIVYEAKGLDIETETPDELERIKSTWKNGGK